MARGPFSHAVFIYCTMLLLVPSMAVLNVPCRDWSYSIFSCFNMSWESPPQIKAHAWKTCKVMTARGDLYSAQAGYIVYKNDLFCRWASSALSGSLFSKLWSACSKRRRSAPSDLISSLAPPSLCTPQSWVLNCTYYMKNIASHSVCFNQATAACSACDMTVYTTLSELATCIVQVSMFVLKAATHLQFDDLHCVCFTHCCAGAAHA